MFILFFCGWIGLDFHPPRPKIKIKRGVQYDNNKHVITFQLWSWPLTTIRVTFSEMHPIKSAPLIGYRGFKFLTGDKYGIFVCNIETMPCRLASKQESSLNRTSKTTSNSCSHWCGGRDNSCNQMWLLHVADLRKVK